MGRPNHRRAGPGRAAPGHALMLRRRAAADERGFSLVEVVVTMGVVFSSILVLIHTATVGFGHSALARQSQGANGVANRLMETIRGLAYDEVKKGLSTDNLPGDARVVQCSGVYRFRTCTGEDIVHTPRGPVAPLVPHTGTRVVPQKPTVYSWSVYITRATGVPQAGAYRATAIVTWDAIRGGKSSTVEAQTLIYSPAGCHSTATHPFAAPCEPFFYGTASAPNGTVDISGNLNGSQVQAVLLSRAARADAQIEQVGHVQGAATASAVKTVGSSTTTLGGDVIGTSADDDPGTSPTPDDHDARSFGPTIARASSLTNAGASLTAAVAAGESGTSVATTHANAVNACPPALSPPPAETDDRPCAYSQVKTGGTLDATLGLDVLGLALGTTSLAHMEHGIAPSWAMADRDAAAGTDGALHETATRTIARLDLLGLPPLVVPPPGWTGYWLSLSGYADMAFASSGSSTSAPVADVQAGVVSYWNGLGYSTIAVPEGAPVTIPVVSVNVTSPVQGKLVDVSISGTVTTGGTSVEESPAGAGSGAARTKAQATVGSPIVANIDYRVVQDGITVADFDVVVNLGALVARASYQPAPTGA